MITKPERIHSQIVHHFKYVLSNNTNLRKHKNRGNHKQIYLPLKKFRKLIWTIYIRTTTRWNGFLWGLKIL